LGQNERLDMGVLQANAVMIEGPDRDAACAGVVTDLDRRRAERASLSRGALQCVSSGYLSGGCSCRSAIPKAVVVAAWRQELDRGRARPEGFYHFAWREGVWLAYGLRDGSVRGVYCPEHSAERDARAFAAEACVKAPARPLAATA
jgi:hypothetical protein